MCYFPNETLSSLEHYKVCISYFYGLLEYIMLSFLIPQVTKNSPWGLGYPQANNRLEDSFLIPHPNCSNVWIYDFPDHGIWTHHFMAIDGETMETVADFILGGSKITVNGDCSHEIKRHLLLGRKVMSNLDSTFKSRDITLSTKVHLVKTMVFPMIMYGCEIWTVKKAESRRIDAFKLWCWRRLLRVPWTARRTNQSILKEISPKYSLEGLMLKLKLQYFGHLMQRADSF